MYLNTDGLVIREYRVGENDRVITVLTGDYGIVRAFANGSKRIKSRTGSATQLLSYSRFVFYAGKEIYSVNEAQSIEIFFDLREDIERLTLAQYFCELSEELAPEMEDSRSFLKLILNALHFLAKGTRPPLLLKGVVELRLMTLAGYMPNLTACEKCGKFESDTMYFDTRNGQLSCSDCTPQGSPVSAGVLKAMRHICYSDDVKLFAFTLSEESETLLSAITERYVAAHISKRFKTLEFFKDLTRNREGSAL
ncbi:MAG: DNA repair protein RecO [Acutalibacteraceae bacterium]|jgi:DNA repair protein RecO (recombination protein O)